MSKFFNLPKYTFLTLCSEWFSMEVLCFLDSATCSLKDRSKYCQLLGFSGFCRKSLTKPVSLEYLRWLKLRNISLTNILIEGHPDIDFSKIINQKFMNNLTSIHINSFCDNMTPILKACNKKNCHLVEIIFTDSQDITDSMLSELFTKCPHIESLSLISCSSISGLFAKSLVKNCSNLHTLVINQCENLVELTGIDSKSSIKKLINLTLSNCKRLKLWRSLISLLSIAPNVSQLDITELEETNATNLLNFPRSQRQIFQLTPKLTNLICVIDSHMLSVLNEMCPLLEYFSLNETDVTHTDLLEYLPKVGKHLKSLTITKNNWISEEIVYALSEYCSDLHTLSVEQGLIYEHNGAQYFDPEHNNAWLSDYSLHSLARKCVNLTHVSFMYCVVLTDQNMLALLHECGTRLETITIRGCSSLSDLCMTKIVSECVNLKHLDCRDLPLVTEYMFSVNTVPVCTQLRYFAWSGCQCNVSTIQRFLITCCTQVTTLIITQFDIYVHYNDLHPTQQTVFLLPTIATYCTQLKYLTINYSHSVSVEALENVLISCQELQSLTLNCNNVSFGTTYEKSLDGIRVLAKI